MLACVILLCSYLGLLQSAAADPISTTPRFSFAGNLDYTVIGGTLRTQPNGTDACAVGNSNSAFLNTIPSGATVVSAFLYWAGSGPTADNSVTLNGSIVNASRTFSENFSLGTLSLDFFSGFADVTGQVTGNGNFTFADLAVTNTDIGTTSPYCSRAAVLSGWGLLVVYSRTSEPLRVINVYDGFQQYRGSQIQVTPSNFRVPASPIDGKIAVLTWEGDVQNSAELNNVSENLTFDGQNTAAVDLVDGLNPLNNQFNSTINITGSTTSYGVDFDLYDISSRLTAGDTSATTTYASGGDLVLLSMQVVSTTNSPVVDLVLNKTLEGSSFSNAAPASYRLTVSNQGPSPESAAVTVTDTLPAGMSFLSASSSDANWACSGTTTVTCTHPGPIAAGSALADVVITASVPNGITAPVTNSATVSSSSFDLNSANNDASHTATTVVTPDLSTSTKTVQDLDGGSLVAGDILRYRINIVETAGAAISGVQVTDTLDALLGNLQIVSDAGGQDNSSTTVLDISQIDIAANGLATITFDAVVQAAAVNGDLISNTADITHTPSALTFPVSSPDLTVGTSVVPTSGTKQLYLGDIQGSTNAPTLPLELTRLPLTANSNPVRVRIRRQDNDRTWRLSPTLASNLGLDTDPIPVRLFMQRNNNTSTRNVRLTLTHGPAQTFIGCVDAAIPSSGASGLSNSVTNAFDFAIQQTDTNCNPTTAVPLTIASGSYLELNVDNDPNPGNNRAIYVYPFANGEPSRLELPATTIINVDSVGWFDAPGGGNPLTTLTAGQVAYLRTTISDPFGSQDITGANFELFDANGATALSGPMVELSNTAGTKTYEAAVTLPTTAINGTWTAAVTANEGTEGTITHTGFQSFDVTGGAGLQVEKTLTVLSDGTASGVPKAIPGALVEYVISVTNNGASAIEADSIEIADSLPAELIYLLGNPLDPVTFVDGSTSSTLTFNFASLASTTDDVAFSNDGGVSFVTPAVAADGSDATVPRINYIQVSPKGTMPGNSGSAPSFEIRLRMRIP